MDGACEGDLEGWLEGDIEGARLTEGIVLTEGGCEG